MASMILILLVLVVTGINAQFFRRQFIHAIQKCPVNEVFEECGTSCEKACDYNPKKCNRMCNDGCFCRSGYVRKFKTSSFDRKSPCVPSDSCKLIGWRTAVIHAANRCPENENFLFCGTSCEEACDHVPRVCNRMCVDDCFCNTGYVRRFRTSFGVVKAKCVPRTSCPRSA